MLCNDVWNIHRVLLLHRLLCTGKRLSEWDGGEGLKARWCARRRQ